MLNIETAIAGELNLSPAQVAAVINLIDDGNTIPFIARYRKEATGGLDDVTLRELDERLSYLKTSKPAKPKSSDRSKNRAASRPSCARI